jgi:hypothetical protein
MEEDDDDDDDNYCKIDSRKTVRLLLAAVKLHLRVRYTAKPLGILTVKNASLKAVHTDCRKFQSVVWYFPGLVVVMAITQRSARILIAC